MLNHVRKLLDGSPTGEKWFSRRLKAAYKLAASRITAADMDPTRPPPRSDIWSKAMNRKINMNIANGAFWLHRIDLHRAGLHLIDFYILYSDLPQMRYLVKRVKKA